MIKLVRRQKSCRDRFYRSVLQFDEIIHFPGSRFFFRCRQLEYRLHNHRNGFLHMVAQKTWFGVEMCLLAILDVKIYFLRELKHQTSPSKKLPTKIKMSEKNSTVTDHQLEIGFAFSESIACGTNFVHTIVVRVRQRSDSSQ